MQLSGESNGQSSRIMHSHAMASALECYARHACAVAAHQAAIARVNRVLGESQALRERLVLAAASRERARIHREHLRSMITEYVQGLRAEGLPPEKMLTTVKSDLKELIRLLPSDAPLPDGDTVTREVTQWAITAYYAA